MDHARRGNRRTSGHVEVGGVLDFLLFATITAGWKCYAGPWV
jgi:hypothetical protein